MYVSLQIGTASDELFDAADQSLFQRMLNNLLHVQKLNFLSEKTNIGYNLRSCLVTVIDS